MIEIKLVEKTGNFAENKDIARDIRVKQLIPSLKKHQKIVLNFSGIDATTQSFIHALISDVIRKFGADCMDSILFKHCSENVQKIINIVVEYMQEI